MSVWCGLIRFISWSCFDLSCLYMYEPTDDIYTNCSKKTHMKFGFTTSKGKKKNQEIVTFSVNDWWLGPRTAHKLHICPLFRKTVWNVLTVDDFPDPYIPSIKTLISLQFCGASTAKTRSSCPSFFCGSYNKLLLIWVYDKLCYKYIYRSIFFGIEWYSHILMSVNLGLFIEIMKGSIPQIQKAVIMAKCSYKTCIFFHCLK